MNHPKKIEEKDVQDQNPLKQFENPLPLPGPIRSGGGRQKGPLGSLQDQSFGKQPQGNGIQA